MIESFLEECNKQIREIIGDHLVGVFLHGSLVFGASLKIEV
ncbi:hypothetical protein [Halobacillus sp. Nhm2S1]|nr:hypothetical protein [Halobacillus sp. Nhm2S1]